MQQPWELGLREARTCPEVWQVKTELGCWTPDLICYLLHCMASLG